MISVSMNIEPLVTSAIKLWKILKVTSMKRNRKQISQLELLLI